MDAPTLSRTLRTVIVILAGTMLAHVAAGASAAPLGDGPPGGLTDPVADLERDPAMRGADALREALHDESYTRKIAGLLKAAGIAPPAPELPAPAAEDLRRVAGLPPGLARPIAELSAAVNAAADMLGTFSPDDIAVAVQAMRAPGSGWVEIRDGAVDDRAPGFAVPDPGADVRLPASASRAGEALPAAAMLVAAALDRAVPALEAAPHTGVTGTAQDCDLVDHAPVLCVGSEADNVHTKDAMLVIDLGGDDTYRNSAGGAPFLPPGAPAYLPVSILVDLDGHDTYEAQRLPGWASWHVTLGQGAAAPGALGLLVDRRGHDRYLVDVPEPPAGQPGVVLAQGGSFGGFAALFDGAGDDEYRITVPDGTAAVSTFAQGTGWRCATGQWAQTSPPYAGAGCAVGALVDERQGDDTYVMDAGRAIGSPEGVGQRVAYAQGATQFGTGVLSDGGGRDSFRITGSAHRTDLLSYPSSSAEIPGVSLNGQASVIAGNAYLLTGHGDTTYELLGEAEGMATGSVWGQAFGAAGWVAGMNHGEALAIIDDLGGDDTYAARMDMHFSPEIVVDDTCTVGGQPCTRAQVLVDAYRIAGSSMMHVQAAGGFDSRPILRDRGGNDTYEAVHDVLLDVTVRDELSDPEEPPLVDVKPYKDTWLYGQAWSLCGGRALLLDEDGRDSYTLRASTHAEARATSAHAQGEPDVRALSGTRLTFGQGAGLTGWACNSAPKAPALVDLGGTGDRFHASSTSTAATSPNPDGALQDACCWGAFQGGVSGHFVADGDQLEITSSPNQGVCEHSEFPRGFGEWMNCWVQGESPDHQTYDHAWRYPSTGRAPSSKGSPTSLEVLTEVPDPLVGRGRLELAARLTGLDGQPIAGAPVVFGFQRELTSHYLPPPAPGHSALPTVPFWANLWEVSGETDEDGVARVRLPVSLERWNPVSKQWFVINPVSSRFQLMAGYDGAPNLYPAKATTPVTMVGPGD